MTPISINEFRTMLPTLFKEIFVQQAPSLLYASIAQNWKDAGGRTRTPNTTTQLRIQSGRLARSFRPNANENIFEFNDKDGNYSITIGSKVEYAAIHEYGGKAGRNHASTIPARPYVKPGIDIFNNKYLPQLVDKFLKKVMETINGQ